MIRRAKHVGEDSWEGEISYRGATFLVEATQSYRRDERVWNVEVLLPAGRIAVKPVHYSTHPTLDSALRAAEEFVRDSIDRPGPGEG